MEMPLIDVLAERVERLEQQNRRLKRTGAAALAGVILLMACVAMAPEKPEKFGVIEVQGLIVCDITGKRLVSLVENPGGTVGLVLYDQSGEARAGIGTNGLYLRDEKGNPRLTAMVDGPDQSPAVTFWSRREQRRCSLGESKGEQIGLEFFDKEGVFRMGAGVSPDNKAGLVIEDKDGKALFQAPKQ
jgi:hypothetical protein